MDKKIKSAQHKKLVAVENIKAQERLKQNFKPVNVGEIPEVMEGLELHRQDFFDAVAKLEEYDDTSDAIQACITDRIDMEERCRRLRSFLRENQRKETNALNDSLLANSTLAFGRPNTSNIRFPKIELPTFDGDSTKWLSFRDRFVAMIDASAELPPIAKLHDADVQCADQHLVRNCPVFLAKNTQERREIARSKGLCWNCLSCSHQVRSCKSEYSCRSCKERHHTLLHQPPQQPKVALSAQSDDDMVFLETAIVFIVDDYGEKHEARALLDSGSMSNFISDTLARKLMTPRARVNVSVSGIGTSRQQIKGSTTAIVRSRKLQFTTPLEFLILDTPSADIPTSPINVSMWNIPDVTLADPTYHIPGKVDVVIGGDTFWELHTGRKQSLGSGLPWLVETQFGCAVAGNTTHSSQQHRVCNMATSDSPLEAILTRFWESETIFDETALSLEEDMCERHFISTTTRDPSGRYVVRLPQNPNSNVVLGESKAIADRRLLAVERRLKSNPAMKEEYSKFMSECERLGHMKQLTEPVDDSCEHYYLPHHAVLKESSTTTKVRVVFDASCKTSSGYSLNDKLLVGPVIQDDLFTIIVRFRSHAVALSADVEKMYRQILHDSRDTEYLRIRYRGNTAEPIQTFQLQTVTYGTSCAPFLATRTLQQIALDHKMQYPRAVDPVLHDFYVDDLLTGTDELADAIEMQRQISEMLKQAAFVLKKWVSNVPEVLIGIPSEDLAILLTHEWQDPQFVSTLGLV
nr:uncharacterized protein LOC120956172 [Anopheles coluzzii]